MPNRETEVKIRIADKKDVRDRLRKLGFRLRHPRSLEDNTLFDTPDRKLRKVRCILRLRHYGGQWHLTYKGTPAPNRFYKSRTEVETEIENPQAARYIFEALGLQPVFQYQKYRCYYELDERGDRGRNLREAGIRKAATGEIAFDETPIGNFLELEGSRRWIDRVARQLGYTRQDYITASYGALYLEDCRKKNIPPGDMVFSRRRRARQTTAPKLSPNATKRRRTENLLTKKP